MTRFDVDAVRKRAKRRPGTDKYTIVSAWDDIDALCDEVERLQTGIEEARDGTVVLQ